MDFVAVKQRYFFLIFLNRFPSDGDHSPASPVPASIGVPVPGCWGVDDGRFLGNGFFLPTLMRTSSSPSSKNAQNQLVGGMGGEGMGWGLWRGLNPISRQKGCRLDADDEGVRLMNIEWI